MTRYLLDTDIFIFLLKNDPQVQAKAQAVGINSLALSAITVAEVLHGAYYSANPTQSLQITRTLISQCSVINLSQRIADKFGEIKADLRCQGLLIADFDLLTAATALSTGRVLVTNNTKHFQRLSGYKLSLENWKI